MSTYPLRATPSANSAPRRGPPARAYIPSSPPPLLDDARRPRALPGNLLIPRLREAIHSLDSKMATLAHQRRDLESRLEQAVRLQSPVLRLPSELLSSIFIIGVVGDAEEDSFESADEGKVSIGSIMLVWQVALLYFRRRNLLTSPAVDTG